jgi:hypothetical protein
VEKETMKGKESCPPSKKQISLSSSDSSSSEDIKSGLLALKRNIKNPPKKCAVRTKPKKKQFVVNGFSLRNSPQQRDPGPLPVDAGSQLITMINVFITAVHQVESCFMHSWIATTVQLHVSAGCQQ